MSDSSPTSGTPHSLAVGDQLGQFKLVELIAIGGMGLVYRAYDTALSRYVAVKVLATELAADPAVAARFLEEARSAAALNHANVVHIYNAGEHAGLFYFVMELVNGQHLESLLTNRAPLPVPAAVDLIRQAALGLQHAYEHGLIHGDVKPANFLVSEAGVVKVTDFGLARNIQAAAASSAGESLFGTPGYVSPEVIQGQPPDHRSDIYSLGATLFHALAGRAPFVGATSDDTLRRQTHDPAPPIQKYNNAVPAAIGQIIARMLATNPADRYQSYTEVLQALAQLTADPALPTAVHPGPLKAKSPPRKPQPKPSVPTSAPAPTVAIPKQESWFTLVFTIIAVFASVLILYLVYRSKLAPPPPPLPPPLKVNPVSTNRPPSSAVLLEAEAQKMFLSLKPKIAAAMSAGNWSQALEISEKWSTISYGVTPTYPAVIAQRKQIQDSARQAWANTRDQITTLTTAGKFAEARDLIAHLEPQYTRLPVVLEQMAESRVAIDQAEQAAEAARTAEKVAAQARLARLDQLRSQVEIFITGYQWEKALQEVQQATTEMGSATEISQPIAELQTELTSLIALRTSVAARLKAKPSPPLALATKTGELQAQVTGVDASTVSLRQILGTTGFAETTVSWTDLTPASACRILMLNLDSNNADELFGYATLLTHQALTKQARIEDARKTLQILVQRSPDRGPWAERHLTRLTELESKTVTTSNPAPEMPRVVDSPAAKIYIPLDISGACNASFFEHGDHGRRSDEFSRKTYISGLPDDGQVPLHDTEPGGTFQLRKSDKPDSIGITWSTGRFPNTVTVKLPATQQRRYLRLAILSAASVGVAIVKAQCAYDNGTTTDARLRIYDWSAAKSPNEAHSALALRDPKSNKTQHLFLDLIDLDAQRRLTAITFAWISTKTEDAQHCVGIFAISALPAEPAR